MLSAASTHPRAGHPWTMVRFMVLSALLMAVVACGGNASDAAADAPVSATIGAAGGKLAGPEGVTLTVPAAAVAADTTFQIVRDDAGAPPIVGMTLLSPVYQVTPHGLALDAHASLDIPYDAGRLPAGTNPVILRGEADGTWHIHPNTSTVVGVATAEVSDFSWFAVGICTPGDAGVFGFGIGDCPANHVLTLNVWGAGAPGTNLTTPLETATDITVAVDWTRPLDIDRTDGILWHGPGITTGSVQFNDPSGLFHREVGRTRLDPATIAGARALGGKVLHYKANAQYCWTGFIIGRGANQTVCWNFDADLPVTVHDVSDPTGPPIITTQPQSTTAVVGSPISFTVAATAPDTLTYSWQVLPSGTTVWSTVPITGPSFDIASARLVQDGSQYRVQVCNTNGALHTCIVSDTVRLTVVATGVAPVFTTTPSGQTLSVGQTASLTAGATGTPAPRIRLYQGAAPGGTLVQECAAPVTGNSSTCTYVSPPLAASPPTLAFYAVADNSVAAITSPAAVVAVTSAATGPVISGQPAATSVTVGGSTTFTVTATGTAPVGYQWLFNGAPIGDRTPAGANSGIAGSRGATLTLVNAQAADAGSYSVVVSNGVASVTSATAQLVVNAAGIDAAPVFLAMPSAQSVLEGGSATFSASAAGSPTPDLTWSLVTGGVANALPAAPGGPFSVGACNATVAYGGANSTSLTLSALTIGCDGTSVVANATNRAGSATSVPALLTVRSNAPSTVGACFGGTSGWCYVQPAPTADTLTGVVIDTAAAKVYAVGVTNGFTMRSSDRGNTWDVAWDATRYNFTDLAQPSSGVLVATGSLDHLFAIFRSVDGGRSWTTVLNVGAAGDSVAGVAFADANVGIAVGSKVWRTTDGGASWTPVSVPLATLPFGSGLIRPAYAGNNVFVTVADTNTNGVSDRGLLLRSTDLGMTWTRVTTAGTDYLTDLSFGGTGFGVAIQQSQAGVLQTNDYGATWSLVPLDPAINGASGVAFSDPNTAVVMGAFSAVSRSTDGGATWSAPDYTLNAGQQGWRVRFADASFGLAVGAYGAVARTLDGGVTWTRIAGGRLDDSIRKIVTAPGGAVTLAAMGATVKRSTDAGVTWNDVPTAAYYAEAMSFANANVAMSFGLFGQVAISSDAGANWTNIVDDATVNFNGGAMVTATTAIAYGRTSGSAFNTGGFMRRTTDAGATWTAVALPTAKWLYPSRFLTASIGLVGGQDGTLLRTTNAGLTWTAIDIHPTNAGDAVRSIVRLSDTVALLSTDNEIKRSTDAGLTWTRVYAQGMEELAFRDGSTGIAVGNTIAMTADGGLTWTALDIPVSVVLFGAAWPSATTPVIGGDGGALLRNQRSGALSTSRARALAVHSVPTRGPLTASTLSTTQRSTLAATRKSASRAAKQVGS